MSCIPQLRVKTEYSYHVAYGSPALYAERLKELGCGFAAMVDTRGTWGHVDWEKSLTAEEIEPGFGAEFIIPQEDGTKPRCWVLATDLASFYRLSSANPTTPEELANAAGVIRFSGAALLEHPEAYDYIDINPRSMLQTRRALDAARRHNKPVVITSDNDYPAPQHEQEFLAWEDSKKMSPQYLLDGEGLREALWYVDDETFQQAVANTWAVAERLKGIRLRRAPIIHVEGDLWSLVLKGKEKRLFSGQIPNWTDEYEQRLNREMDMIRYKEYESYFLVVADLVNWAKQHMLVGPARGSSAGSLVCYLTGITEVDPLVHGLIFERFIDINRADLPDIDIDFNDQKRHMVFEYLAEKYGAENVAHIGNVIRMKPRSVIAHAGKKLRIPKGATFAVTNVLIEYSSGDSRYGKGLEDTLNNTNPGLEFQEKYPESWLMGVLENHASHTGVHAAGIIVSNEPVVEYCTVREGIAQVDKGSAEYLNLLKIDALGLRTLGVIEDSGCVTPDELYSLSLDDPAVLDVFNQRLFSGIFQFEGAAQRRVSMQVPIDDFKKIDHVTALARPGPLGGGAAGSYIARNAGEEPIEYKHPSMEEYLGETMGVVLYQEQVMRIVRELGQFSWEETSVIRKAMSGRKGKEFFDRRGEMFAEGASEQGIDRDLAMEIWEEICSFGAWGMNKSHTVSYAMISYWCAYMKHHHAMEYAAACMRSAKDDEQVIELLRELDQEGVEFIPFDPDLSDQNWAAKEGKLVGGYSNLNGIGPVKAKHYVEKRDQQGLTDKEREKLLALTPRHNELYEGKRLWKDMYENPRDYNVRGQIKLFGELKDRDEAVVIAKLVRRERRDENETVRAARRGYELPGETLFLDCFVVDDSVSKPVLMRIKPRMWESTGKAIADQAVDGQDWFLVRGFWLAQFSMMIVKKIKCLTNPSVTGG